MCVDLQRSQIRFLALYALYCALLPNYYPLVGENSPFIPSFKSYKIPLVVCLALALSAFFDTSVVSTCQRYFPEAYLVSTYRGAIRTICTLETTHCKRLMYLERVRVHTPSGT